MLLHGGEGNRSREGKGVVREIKLRNGKERPGGARNWPLNETGLLWVVRVFMYP